MKQFKTYFQIKKFVLKEQFRTFSFYYQNRGFALADALVGLTSFFVNPYRACRKHFERRGEEGVYGETPLSVFDAAMTAANLKKGELYIELGSGRGKTCFWAACFRGARVIGVECVPIFAFLSRLIASLTKTKALFVQDLAESIDLTNASVVYLSMLHLGDQATRALEARLTFLSSNCRLITISEPIFLPGFITTCRIPAKFGWGETYLYVQVKQ